MQIKNMFLNVKKFFSFNSFALALTAFSERLRVLVLRTRGNAVSARSYHKISIKSSC